MSKPASLSDVKIGSYILIDGEPCRIIEYDKSKPGKHGSAKARVVATGIFDGSKHSLVSPVSAGIEIPMSEKRTGQIISINKEQGIIQIMDMETFETFDSPPSDDKKISNKLIEGVEVEYWKVLGKTKIVRIR